MPQLAAKVGLLKLQDLGAEALISKTCAYVETAIRMHCAQLASELEVMKYGAPLSQGVSQTLSFHRKSSESAKPTLDCESLKSSIPKSTKIPNYSTWLDLRSNSTITTSALSTSDYSAASPVGGLDKIMESIQIAAPTSANVRSARFVSEFLPIHSSERSVLLRMVTSKKYDRLLCLLILSNAVFMGIHMMDMTQRKSTKPVLMYTVFEAIYAVIFVVEIALRIFAHGSEFFTSREERAWNVFEFCVVALSTIQTGLNVWFPDDLHHVAWIGVVRSLRALRILRVVVSIKGLRPLRLLVTSIISTLTSCFWALLLLVFIVYIFGMAFTHAALEHSYDCNDFDCEILDVEIVRYFGTLPKSLLTLFETVCGGVSWGEPVAALGRMGSTGSIYVGVFLLYVAFTYFAVLNVVTALFCQHAVENAVADQDILLERQQEGLSKMRDRLQDMFRRLDQLDQSQLSPKGVFTLGDLDCAMQNAGIVNDFSLLGIEPDDAWTLFKLLDVEGVGAIDMDHFVCGCMHLRGAATKMDVQLLLFENRFLFHRLEDVASRISDLTSPISKSLLTANQIRDLIPQRRFKAPDVNFDSRLQDITSPALLAQFHKNAPGCGDVNCDPVTDAPKESSKLVSCSVAAHGDLDDPNLKRSI